VAGVVLNRPTLAQDPSEPHNLAEIERLTGARVLATLPHEPDPGARARLLVHRLVPAVQF